MRTRHNFLYTGIAVDVSKRFAEHQQGKKGAKYLRSKGPLELVYFINIGSRSLASRVEYRLKRLTKVQKERIVAQSMSRRDLFLLLKLEDSAI